MPPSDPQGRVALMLFESLLHVLVDESVLTKSKAIEAIETVLELTRDIADAGSPNPTDEAAISLVEGIAESFRIKD
jgi:hypothetical protein